MSASVLAIRNSFRWLAAAVLACIFSQHVWAASVTVGNHVLLPDTPNQIVSLYVSGGEQIAGEDFFAQVGDGGTFNGGVNTKPTFTYVDMVYGSIFGENNNGPFGDPGNGSLHPLIWVDSTTTISGTVSANGRLAVLVLDTTGLFSGTFPLLLTGVANSYGSFNTTLRDASANLIPLNISNGSLIVATPTPGDFNLDGEVDSADYVAWRNGLGTKYTPADYSDWRANFGQVIGAGAGLDVSASVPEPTSLLLLLIGMLSLLVAGAARHRCKREVLAAGSISERNIALPQLSSRDANLS